ncbi:hypothetical protein L226DRAFT_483343 [Lentinus tigrinus ALCF2SS1-7]|uniref:uncharacterized protein n=1 Tax=Lentinus tigrinus ALCF2SS1-7 TaxID=1328758 RepID=UPI0011660D83|nr:hypothetical protein L226DRAFT_483343 [Lentinus tigrinus ALCF2SS1-7]
MPITRYITVRPSKLTANDALSALIATSSVTREIADLLQFAPAKAAAGILLLIFETVKNVQTNRQDCHRLARRCLSLLVDIRDQLADHAGPIPPRLVKAISKFEETLESIYKYMKQEAEQKWGARLMRKSTIENALTDYNAALDDAARAFQIATLINIHLAVGDASTARIDEPADCELAIVTARGEPSGSTTSQSYASESTCVDGGEAILDVQELSLSPISRSATSTTFELLDRAPPSQVVDAQARQTDSFDLIDLSSSSSGEFLSVETSSRQILHVVEDEEEEETEPVITNHHGFSRYHQSQFRLKPRSRVIKEGWWAGATEGRIDGQESLMLRYEGDRRNAMKRWVRDVKLLQNVYHPNLPQMVGYSNDETPTPFLLLANVQTRLPQALLLDSLKNASLAQCAQIMLQFYRETLDAALYLQQQLNLSDSKLQDYVENASYRIDAERTVIMGLPPPEIDNRVSWRNYGLASSIRDIYLKILPNHGSAPKQPDSDMEGVASDLQRKVNHLTILARALLPNSDDIKTVKERLQKLLGSVDDEEGFSETPLMTLRQIRKAAFAANVHQQAWFENQGIPPHKFRVGDLGYLPKDTTTEGKDWTNFVVLCNILEEGLAKLDVSDATVGHKGSWQDGFHEREDITPYELPGGLHGWAVAVPPEAEYDIDIVHTKEFDRVHDAWDYLLDVGKAMAETHDVKPEELILITRVGAEQRFKVRDLRRVQYNMPESHGSHYGRGGHTGFGQHSAHNPYGLGRGAGHRKPVRGQDLSFKIFYVFTSASKDHEPYFSQTPIPTPQPQAKKPQELDPNTVKCFAFLDVTYGFLNYVQLHAEDFAD